ncbi:unnamed protein product [marine sediment metagenome]|uniref:Uncharacterized protein n=1 Tax=marine sediment metagenome TaxID=412755 RepID=X1MRB1_9ZZZZ
MSNNYRLEYELIEKTVGSDYISDDFAIPKAYSRTCWVLGRENKDKSLHG